MTDLIKRLLAEETDLTDCAADRIEALINERDEWQRIAGGGCDAANGGHHTVIREGKYSFCAKCGESLKGIRFCHEPRNTLAEIKGESHE